MYRIIYEDDNLLTVSKKQGVPVQPDKNNEPTLIDELRRVYGNSCELCHRLDRNTGGLILIARNQNIANLVINGIRDKKVSKTYRFIVSGKLLSKPDASGKRQLLEAWHFKDSKKSRVYIYNEPRKYSKKIITLFKTIAYDKSTDTSLIEAELVTGRTHQIRAHFAYLGHPVIGDGKYGSNKVNRHFGYKFQALWAYKFELNGLLKAYGVPDVFISPPEFM